MQQNRKIHAGYSNSC